MIIYEDYNEFLVRAYSDENFYIERDEVLYEEAIDPKNYGRVYTETDIPIEEENIEENLFEEYNIKY